MINIKDLDQSTWSCYQLDNNSYYYGEIGYLDESGIVHPKENNEAVTNPKNKLVKHGYGVYLYNLNSLTQKPEQKYLGQWDRDEKSGKGQLIMENGTIYEGNFHEGHYHGSGKITWPSGDSYDGMWKRSKMEGSGVFKQSQTNTTLKGLFKNNYYIDDNILRNPFLTEKEYSLYKKERKEVIRQKEKQEKIKYGFVKKLSHKDEIKECVEKSIHSNRIPMILSTKSLGYYNLESLDNDLQTVYGNQEQQQTQRKINIMDLRKLYMLKGEEKEQYRQEVHEMYRQSLINGEIFLISMDDSEIEFTEMFYPDLKEFYETNGFNALAWSRSELIKPEVRKRIINGEEINENFKLIIWTKFKVEAKEKEDRILDQVTMRFEKILPMVKIDLLVINQNESSKEQE